MLVKTEKDPKSIPDELHLKQVSIMIGKYIPKKYRFGLYN